MNRDSKSIRNVNKNPIYTDKSWVQSIIFGLLLFFCLFQTYYIFYYSSYFTIEKIKIKGNKEIRDQDLVFQSGLTPGQKMIEVNFEEVIQKVLKNPVIKEASILQSGAKEIQITVEEHQAKEYFLAGKDAFGLSENGVLIPKKVDPSCRIEINLSLLEKEMLKMKKDRLKITREWIKQLKESRFFNYDRVIFQGLFHIWIYYDGFNILVGDIKYFKKHLKMLEEFIFSYDENIKKPEYVDIRFENMVVKMDQ